MLYLRYCAVYNLYFFNQSQAAAFRISKPVMLVPMVITLKGKCNPSQHNCQLLHECVI